MPGQPPPKDSHQVSSISSAENANSEIDRLLADNIDLSKLSPVSAASENAFAAARENFIAAQPPNNPDRIQGPALATLAAHGADLIASNSAAAAALSSMTSALGQVAGPANLAMNTVNIGVKAAQDAAAGKSDELAPAKAVLSPLTRFVRTAAAAVNHGVDAVRNFAAAGRSFKDKGLLDTPVGVGSEFDNHARAAISHVAKGTVHAAVATGMVAAVSTPMGAAMAGATALGSSLANAVGSEIGEKYPQAVNKMTQKVEAGMQAASARVDTFLKSPTVEARPDPLQQSMQHKPPAPQPPNKPHASQPQDPLQQTYTGKSQQAGQNRAPAPQLSNKPPASFSKQNAPVQAQSTVSPTSVPRAAGHAVQNSQGR